MVGWLLRPANAGGWPGHVRSDQLQPRTLTRRQASQAGDRAKGFSCAGMLSLIASFCGAFPDGHVGRHRLWF